jgi:riboflavin biosynthesis pyrimidine reductase
MSKGLVDEIVLYVAPSLMGQDAAPLVYLGAGAPRDGARGDRERRDRERRDGEQGADASGLSRPFEFSDVRRVGDDVRLVLTSRKH